MFGIFSLNKCRYEKGQVFPFLIAILVVMIILIMITVNLGQIGIFKTDASNAVDAAALAAASVLSGTLLSFGAKSDLMCGFGIVCTIAIIIAIRVGGTAGLIVAALIGLAFAVSQWVDWKEAWYAGQMGCSNAKKTAFQYAFQNVGIDQPKPTFKQFLENAYGITDPSTLPAETLNDYYEEYIKEESPIARANARNGFSRFMEDWKHGYWDKDEFCDIAPGEWTSQAILTRGYGWTQNADGSFLDSYSQNAPHGYQNYDDWVEVKVIGGLPMYASLDLYNLPGQEILAGLLAANVFIQKFAEYCAAFSWLGPLAPFIAAALAAVHAGVTYNLVMAISWGLTMNEQSEVDNNYITVSVKRHKANQDLGLWEFKYGTVGASARSHTFRENVGGAEESTVDPAFLADIGDVIEEFFVSIWSGDWDFTATFFNAEEHLFEVELAGAYSFPF